MTKLVGWKHFFKPNKKMMAREIIGIMLVKPSRDCYRKGDTFRYIKVVPIISKHIEETE